MAQAVRDLLNGFDDRLTGFDGLEQWRTRLCSSGEEGACATMTTEIRGINGFNGTSKCSRVISNLS